MMYPVDKSNMIALAGLNLALSYENAAVARLENRVSETIDWELKERLDLHLARQENTRNA